MFEQIKNQISKLIDLEPKELEHFTSKLQVKHFDKKELVLQEGKVCKHSYFINKGCLRYFYNVDGQENTGQFFFENG